MNKLILSLFFVTTSLPVFTQIYFCDDKGRIGTLTTEDCNAEYVRPSFRDPPFSFTRVFGDIALHPDGRLFGVTGSEQTPILVEISLLEGQIIDTLGIIPDDNASSLVCNREGILYTGFDRLHAFDLITQEFTTYGRFPNLRHLLGDLIIIDNKLYGSLGDPLPDRSYIYELQLDNLTESPLILTFPVNKWVAGLAIQIEDNCAGRKLIGSHHKLFEDETDIYSLDLANGTIDSLCQITLPFGELVYGLTSTDEFRQNCQLRLDLDADDSSGRLIDHYYADSFCVVNFPIADQDLSIKTSYAVIDSIRISVEQGILAPGQEVIKAEPRPGLALRGTGTDQLLVINQGALSTPEIEQFLGTVRFEIQATQPESGERVVHTVLYAAGTASDIAKSFIQVSIGQPPSAGQDAYVEVCYGGFRVDLFERLGGEPRAGGWWEPPLNGGDRFYALEDTSGTYQYLVQEGGCGADTAEVEVFVHPQPPIGLGENGELVALVEKCPGDTLFWDISIPNGFAYWWRDGQQGPVATLVEPGVYAGEVIDSTTGCFWYSKTVVEDYEPLIETQIVNLCEGQSWSWEAGMIYRDTILCQAWQDANGCQGQRCFDVRFAPPQQQWETLYFCEDEQPVIEGVSIRRDTSFCLPASGSGCGLQSCYIALFTPPVQGYRRVEICAGESLVFGNEMVQNAGIYNAMLQASDGCDSLAILELIVHPTYESIIDTIIPAGTSVQVGDRSFSSKGDYNITLASTTGCDSLIQLNLDVQATQYYAPGLVQPKGSGWGRVFTLYTKHQLPATIWQLSIFNAAGQVVFQQENSSVSDETKAWTADFNGRSPHAAGVYFYQAEVEDATGRKEFIQGRFILMY